MWNVGVVVASSTEGAIAVLMPTTPPPPVAALLAGVQDLGDGDLREHLQQLTAEQRAGWVVSLHQLLDTVQGAVVAAVDVFDRRGDGEALHGARSTAAWLRGACRSSAVAAHQRVRMARRSRTTLAAAMAAVAAGEITYEHLCAVARGTRAVPDDQCDRAAQVLTDLSRVAPVEHVQVAGRRLREVLDPDGAALDLERQFDRRHLTISPLLDGMSSVDGVLDAEGAALPVSGGERPQLRLVVDGRSPSVLTLSTDDPWLPEMSLRRIICDAALSRLLLDEHGTVVDLGRERRLFTPHQRRLLALRDGGCRWPGCTRPAAHTDAHHLRSWVDGGATDADNAVLLCRFHHRLAHEGGWRIAPEDRRRGARGSLIITGPHGQSLLSQPRGP